MKDKNTGIPINQEKIQQYLKDIRRIKVMTPQREKELAKIMKSGTLTDAQRDKVHKELLEGNLRFVITVAKQYQNQGLDFPDLIAEGNFGLMKAIKNFDWHKDLRFISYAVWWVKQSILQSLNDNARTIRLPVNVVQDLHRAKKAIESNDGTLDPKFQRLPSMIDLDMRTFNHGGGNLKNEAGFPSTFTIAEGALQSYTGPCPPNFSAQGHDYEITVIARDKNNQVLGKGSVVKTFSAKTVKE